MRWVPGLLGLAMLLAAWTPTAEAKSYRYASGPKAAEDTVLTSADVAIEPIVRSRGPRIPATNLQLTSVVANTAVERAMRGAPLDSGAAVLLAPAESHPLNFVLEHAVLRELGRRGVTAQVRRSIIPDDSLLAVTANPGEPVLEYQLASARVTYLRLTGWLPGRVNIERQSLVEAALTLREPATARVLWTGDATYNLVDQFRRGQLELVEDARFTDLQSPPPQRNVDKVLEPVIVVGVVAGLVALFFQNRP
jgi:hypothetical protein